MNLRTRTLTSLTTLAVFGLTVASVANAASSRDEHRADEQIQACVAEVGKHADYRNASRELRRVATLNQKNLIELEIRIETSVFSVTDDMLVREYAVSCVTDTMGDVVKFRINTA
jgi:hypothetical protein